MKDNYYTRVVNVRMCFVESSFDQLLHACSNCAGGNHPGSYYMRVVNSKGSYYIGVVAPTNLLGEELN